jgi:hypothetical protein
VVLSLGPIAVDKSRLGLFLLGARPPDEEVRHIADDGLGDALLREGNKACLGIYADEPAAHAPGLSTGRAGAPERVKHDLAEEIGNRP